MPYVVRPVTLPANLVGVPNGKLSDDLLETIGPSGRLHETAARSWRALRAAAADAGFNLTYTFGGTYRTYAQQEALFRSRYSPQGTFGGCKAWDGQRWCLKGPYAMAAVPGTSNHGLGLAVDTALDLDPSDGVGPDDAVSIMPAIPWLVANAERFGWSWEAQSEPWHLRYVTGDVIPQAVLDFERPPPPPVPSSEVDVLILNRKPGTPEWDAMTWTGTHLAGIRGGIDLLRAAGVPEFTVPDDDAMDRIIHSGQTTNECPPAMAKIPRLAQSWLARKAT